MLGVTDDMFPAERGGEEGIGGRWAPLFNIRSARLHNWGWRGVYRGVCGIGRSSLGWGPEMGSSCRGNGALAGGPFLYAYNMLLR